MKVSDMRKLLFFFLALCYLAMFCGEQEQVSLAEVGVTDEDTTQVMSTEPEVTQIPGLKKEKQDLETRLEALLSLIEQKESSLLKREQEVLDRERKLRIQARALDNRERRLSRLQITSLIAVGIGIATLVFGLILAMKNRPSRGRKIALRGTNAVEDAKAAYVKKMEAQLKEWQQTINELKVQAKEAKEGTKEEIEKRLKSLQSKQRSATRKMKALKDSSGSSWQDLKSGVDMAWEEIKKALDDVSSRVKKE